MSASSDFASAILPRLCTNSHFCRPQGSRPPELPRPPTRHPAVISITVFTASIGITVSIRDTVRIGITVSIRVAVSIGISGAIRASVLTTLSNVELHKARAPVEVLHHNRVAIRIRIRMDAPLICIMGISICSSCTRASHNGIIARISIALSD
eukprot:TRINITY_DN6480_c1_g1_i1.p3 TRINITY_DN6480_c1_g1~~TRINITY_DN6480_c1_g1_i1.p3  ORF type:complete len:153 (-),score=13.27 TRINITY_DN6480_c1_g1_i1:230-688(-)